jgi:uncharacterized protein (DUF1330 family)
MTAAKLLFIDGRRATGDGEPSGASMAKVYFVSIYRQVKDPDKFAAYAKLAGPAIEAAGGRFLARGMPSKAYEAGQLERTVIIEFDSLQQVTAMYEGPAYQRALQALGDGAVRDIRIVGGV